MKLPVAIAVAVAASGAWTLGASARQDRQGDQRFSFRTAVELVSVSVTVTDAAGRFVPGLRREDFVISEDGEAQTVSQFEAERVPVSLGLLVDTSGSMLGEKIVSARSALRRFLVDLLGPQDEVFLYRFDSRATLVQPWTRDRLAVSTALAAIKPFGGTAMFDAVAEAVPLAERGTNPKKAIVVISDGNDTSSTTTVAEVQRRVRESEVLVYAIGVDSDGGPAEPASRPSSASTARTPAPSPFPGAASPPTRPSSSPSKPSPSSRGTTSARAAVNANALRSLTDDSGGRVEMLVSPRDLDAATAGIANELSRQYYLGYVSTRPRDGKWHAIDVQVRRNGVTVRARRGFISG